MNTWISNITPVFMLFLIPVGGGIPAGVLLAHNKGLHWLLVAWLYFLSDVALAFAFEPILRILVWVGKRIGFIARMTAAVKRSIARKAAEMANKGMGTFALIIYSFVIDPMTGRAAAMAMGHRFVGGWAIAITGDMMTYVVVAVSTLKLNAYFHNQTTTMLVVLGAMVLVAFMARGIRSRLKRREQGVE